MAKGQWHWQERGTAWKGIGIYHVTLTVTNRQPILGDLVIPNDDPSNAYINESPLGKDLVQCVIHWHEHYPEIRVLQFCLMPDHLHVIVHVQRTMPYGIMTVVRGLWQAAKKLGRAYSAEKRLSFNPNTIGIRNKRLLILFSRRCPLFAYLSIMVNWKQCIVTFG